MNFLQYSKAIINGSQLDTLKGPVLFCSARKTCLLTVLQKTTTTLRVLSLFNFKQMSLHLMATCQKNMAGVDRTLLIIEERKFKKRVQTNREMKRGR